jgi:hypothetical protein
MAFAACVRAYVHGSKLLPRVPLFATQTIGPGLLTVTVTARRHFAEMNGERAEQETRAARLSSTFTRYGHLSHLTDTEISKRQPILGSFCSSSSSSCSRFWDDIAYAQHVEAEQDQHGHCTIYVHTVLHDRTSRAQIHGRFACFVPSV